MLFLLSPAKPLDHGIPAGGLPPAGAVFVRAAAEPIAVLREKSSRIVFSRKVQA